VHTALAATVLEISLLRTATLTVFAFLIACDVSFW
jgi:hypothetical protein